MDKNTVIAIDLAKTKFEIAVSEKPGQVSRHRRLDRRAPHLLRPDPRRHRRHGSLRVGPPLGSPVRKGRTRSRPSPNTSSDPSTVSARAGSPRELPR